MLLTNEKIVLQRVNDRITEIVRRYGMEIRVQKLRW